MTEAVTTREAIVQALFALVAGDGWFPDDERQGPDGAVALQFDAEEPDGWRALPSEGLQDCAAVNDQDDDAEVTAEVLGADDDPAGTCFEITLSPTLAYCVAGADRRARRARRDQAAVEFERLLALDRTLGLGPQVYARIAGASRRDNVPTPHALPVALLILTLEVDYVAATPAG